MQDVPQDTLNETTRTEQSARISLWEFDATAIGGERYFFCNEPNEKGEPVPRQLMTRLTMVSSSIQTWSPVNTAK
ncbi:phage minor tail protein [Escherichia coli]|nr:phage minor tail protein [Escherichia coli]